MIAPLELVPIGPLEVGRTAGFSSGSSLRATPHVQGGAWRQAAHADGTALFLVMHRDFLAGQSIEPLKCPEKSLEPAWHRQIQQRRFQKCVV